jgi:hypothetical protein
VAYFLPANVWGACSGEILQSLDEPPVIRAQYSFTGQYSTEPTTAEDMASFTTIMVFAHL